MEEQVKESSKDNFLEQFIQHEQAKSKKPMTIEEALAMIKYYDSWKMIDKVRIAKDKRGKTFVIMALFYKECAFFPTAPERWLFKSEGSKYQTYLWSTDVCWPDIDFVVFRLADGTITDLFAQLEPQNVASYSICTDFPIFASAGEYKAYDEGIKNSSRCNDQRI